MIYFYCQSYQALNMALSLTLVNKVNVISSSDDIIEACKFLGVGCVKLISFKESDYIRRFRFVKREMVRIAGLIGDDEFHFSHTQFAIFGFFMVKYLNVLGKRIVFYNFEYRHKKAQINCINLKLIRKSINTYYLRCLHSLPLELRTTNGRFMISLEQKYINKVCDIVDNKSEYYNTMIDFFKEVNIDSKPIKTLFIHQILDSEYNEESYRALHLLNNNNVAIKTHPNHSLKDEFDQCETLPAYVPVEYYYNKVGSCIISFYSYALVTASQWDNVKVISLIDLLGANEYYMNIKKDLAEKSNNRIHFVSSIEELNNILEND